MNPTTSSIDYEFLGISEADQLAIERMSADIRVPRTGRGVRLETGSAIERLYRDLRHPERFDLRILKLKNYGLSDRLDQWTMDRIISKLMDATTVQVLYIQNFPLAMQDAQLEHLTEVLKKGHIWALNIGEASRVTRKGWEKFATDLADTNVTHMYASENTLLTEELKTRMLDAVRKNRVTDKRHYNKENSEIINKVTNMWFNPKASKKYQKQFADPSEFCDGQDSCLNHNDQHDRVEEVDNWVQCVKEGCKKWRRIPHQASEIVVSDLPENWHCGLNRWDPMHNDCAQEEEKATSVVIRGGGAQEDWRANITKKKKETAVDKKKRRETGKKQKVPGEKAKKKAEQEQKAAKKMAKKKAKREQKKAEMGAKKEEKKRLKKVIKMEKAFEKEERKLEKVLRKKLEALEEAKDVTGSKKRKAGDTRVLTLQSPKQKKKKLEEPEFSPFDSSSVSLTRMSHRQQVAHICETSEREHLLASDASELVGERIRIFSQRRRDWVEVAVSAYNPATKVHTVQLGDGKYLNVNLYAVRVRKMLTVRDD